MDVIFKAKSFLRGVYAAQGGGAGPAGRFGHAEAVARLVWEATLNDVATAAALLHDVLTGTRVTAEALMDAFGYDVAALVIEVSAVAVERDGSRAFRAALDRAHVAKASPVGQTIKLADLIDGAGTERAQNPHAWRDCADELRSFLEVLPLADRVLLRRARALLEPCATLQAA